MDLTSKKCVPCEGGTPPFTRAEAEDYLKKVSGWELCDEHGPLEIEKKFTFDSYIKGIDFVNKVAKLAESEGHHPDMKVGYGKVKIKLNTHAVGGLSENDFIIAAKIDQLVKVEP